MSWWGAHPVLPKQQVLDSRAAAGLPRCRLCEYYERVFPGPATGCYRCSAMQSGEFADWLKKLMEGRER